MANGVSNVTLLGMSPGVTTGYSVVWGLGPTAYAQLLSGVAMEVVSNSANDAAAGTGARTVRVWGVDGNYLPFSETVTLNGATPVALTNTSVIGINGAEVLTSGSGGTNAGRIDVRTVAGATVKATIRASADVNGLTHDFIFTVPAGQYAKLKKILVSVGGIAAGYMTITLKTFSTTGNYKANGLITTNFDVIGFSGGPMCMSWGEDGLFIPAKTLIQLQASMSAGTALYTSAIGELELYSA